VFSYALTGFGRPADADPAWEDGRLVTTADCPNPSELITLTETRDVGPYLDHTGFQRVGPNEDRGTIHHHRTIVNFLFLDGHVKGLKAIQTFVPKSLWGTDVHARLDSRWGDGTVPADAVKNILPEYR
jgi:prepilin-type processing-associated H-X9-DG protein